MPLLARPECPDTLGTALKVVSAGAENIQVGGGPGVFATERCAKAYPNVTDGDHSDSVGEVEVIPLLSLISELGNMLILKVLA